MSDRLEANIAARKAAEEVFGLGIDECGILCKKFDLEATLRFWSELRELIYEVVPLVAVEDETVRPMSDVESQHFGLCRMTFGQYEGQCVDDIPYSYLDYLITETEFKKSLRRYLVSDRIRNGPQD